MFIWEEVKVGQSWTTPKSEEILFNCCTSKIWCYLPLGVHNTHEMSFNSLCYKTKCITKNDNKICIRYGQWWSYSNVQMMTPIDLNLAVSLTKTFSTLFCKIWIESQNVLSHQTEKWLFDWPLFIISVSPTKGREKNDYDRGTSRTIRLLCLYAGYYTYENTKGISPFDAAFPLFSTYDFWFFIQIFHTMSLMIQRPRDSHAAFIHYQ